VVFKGNLLEYEFDFSTEGKLVITDTIPNRDGQDTLVEAELLRFYNRDYRVSELKDFEHFYRLVHKDVNSEVQDGKLNSGIQHYELYGRNEGREASTNFNEKFYRLLSPDVDTAIKEGKIPSALFHYLNWGYAEKRVTNFNFNEKFYRLLYPDVDTAIKAGSQGSALIHYINHGYQEGRVTNISFDEQYYRNNNADVDTAIRNGTQISGLSHYINYGYNEKRIAKYNALNSNAPLWGSRNSDILEGSNGNNFIDGNDGNDTLIGGDGNDIFLGHTGNDSLDGGTGIDNAIYRGNFEDYHVVFYKDFIHVSDTVSNRSDTDTLVNIENLQFETSLAVYKTLSLSSIKDLGARFSGLEGNDVVTGGNGNDFYVRGNAGDDTLHGLLGDDTLYGNDGNDSLDGGDGNDFMEGGSGNDIYIVNAAGDVVKETSGLITEIDTIQSSITYTLGANLENLTLTGTTVINGTGNALDNIIYGNSAGNIINGGAGNDFLNGQAGNDTLIGGLGNDIYIVDFVGDVVTENSTLTTEVDTVRSYVSYTLGANLENLTLLGSVAINAVGNGLNNVIAGNVLNNTLTGGAGVDTFVLNKTSADTITDFATNEKLQISASEFGGLTAGSLATTQLLVGAGATAATTATQRFIFNTTDKSLYFDSDGLNGSAAVKIGVLAGSPTLNASNFSIVA
jgi:Ca2+-binding RTX toxin-like protein